MIRFHFQHFLRAVILAGFAIFFIQLHYTGDITKYINPKYNIISQIAAGMFVFLFLIQVFRIWEYDHDKHSHCGPGCDHDHGYSDSSIKKVLSYTIIVFPLVTGFVLSPTILDSSIAANKGTILPPASGNQNRQGEGDSGENPSVTGPDGEVIQDGQAALPNNNFLSKEQYNERMKKLEQLDVIEMKNDIFSPYYETMSIDPKAYIGKTIKVTGFVYKEEGFDSNQLVVSRFLITHCIADASIIGFLTEFEEANVIEKDTWIEIEGTIDVTTYNGVEIPMIKANKWEAIEEPSEPYIYPVLTSLVE